MIARDDGQVVLVSGAIPGERVTARIDRVAKGVAHADDDRGRRAVARSPRSRRAIRCAAAASTATSPIRGSWRSRAQVIADAFARIGRIELPAPVAVARSPEDGYRMRARLHVRGARVGFFREGTHDLCDARATRQLLPATRRRRSTA